MRIKSGTTYIAGKFNLLNKGTISNYDKMFPCSNLKVSLWTSNIKLNQVILDT